MDIAVVGATGDIGREVVTCLVRDQLIPATSRLQLVGRGRSQGVLHGLAADLREAYHEIAPMIDVATRPEDIVADVVVMTAGVTPRTVDGRMTTRDETAVTNAPIFRRYARSLAKHGSGHEVVLVVSNPVELAVQVFCEELGDRHRVIGMGAFNDSLRFRAEVAGELHVRRHRVQGFVIGEHGSHLVPLWSSIRVFGMESEELAEHLTRLRRDLDPAKHFEQLAENARTILGIIEKKQYREAYAYAKSLPPDLSFALTTYITHYTSKTVNATARSTVDFIRNMTEGREQVLPGQMMLDGEFHGLKGPFGVPLMVSANIRGVVPITLNEVEMELAREANRVINAKIHSWLEAAYTLDEEVAG